MILVPDLAAPMRITRFGGSAIPRVDPVTAPPRGGYGRPAVARRPASPETSCAGPPGQGWFAGREVRRTEGTCCERRRGPRQACGAEARRGRAFPPPPDRPAEWTRP